MLLSGFVGHMKVAITEKVIRSKHGKVVHISGTVLNCIRVKASSISAVNISFNRLLGLNPQTQLHPNKLTHRPKKSINK